MKNVFFTKLITTYSIIVFSILFLVFFSYYFTNQGNAQKKLLEANTKTFSQSVDKNEVYLKVVIGMCNAILKNSAAHDYALSSSESYYSSLTKLVQESNMISSGLSWMNTDIAIHKLNDDTVIFRQTSGSLDTLLNDLNISPAVYEEAITTLSKSTRKFNMILVTDRKFIYITKNSYGNKEKLILMVIADLPSVIGSSAEDGLQFNIQKNGDSFLDLRTKATFKIAEKELSLSANQGIQIRKEQSGVALNATSELADFSYIGRFDTSTRKDDLFALAYIIVMFLAAFFISFIIIAFFSRRLYRPIESLIQTFMTLDINNAKDIREKNEIEYMAKQVVSLRENYSELSRNLVNSHEDIVNKLIYDIFMGTRNAEDIYTTIGTAELEWLDEGVFVAIIEIPLQHAELEKVLQIEKIIKTEVERIAKQTGILLSSTRLGIIIQGEDIQPILNCMNSVVVLIDTAFSIRLTAGISNPCENIQAIKVGYSCAEVLLEKRYFMETRNIYIEKYLEDIKTDFVLYPIDVEYKIVTAVEKNRQEEAVSIMNYIFDEYISQTISSENWMLVILALINTLNRCAHKAGLSEITRNNEFILLELKMCGGTEELRIKVLDVLKGIFYEMEHSSDIKINATRDRLIQFIDENFKRDISLLDISEHLNLTPNYTSTLFKAIVGENFKDFLSKYRFDRAVEILKAKPSIKLSDLSEAVGISNVGTLLRIFKRYAGMTPGQYVDMVK